ncbi:hypothetical protein FACS1894153_0350 [Bacteroidia bacterium]|nr:hypothetical protein FACS1894153_0350 [Bacteroidia bacterium]
MKAENIFKHKTFLWLLIGVVVIVSAYLWLKWMQKYAPKKDITDDIVVDKNSLSYQASQ